MISFGVHLYTYASRMDETVLGILPRLKETGFEWVEIPLISQHLDLLDPEKARSVLKDLEMSSVTGTGISPEMDIISDDEDTRARGIEHLKRCVDITARMGGTLLAGALYAAFGMRPQKGRNSRQWEYSVRSLREVGRFAAREGITLGLEPLNRYEHFL